MLRVKLPRLLPYPPPPSIPAIRFDNQLITTTKDDLGCTKDEERKPAGISLSRNHFVENC
jgi:hypothetical protein